MHIKTFWIVLFVFSIFVYGNSLKKIGKINNFTLELNVLVASDNNTLINPHYIGVNDGYHSRTLLGVDIYDIANIKQPHKLSSIPLKQLNGMGLSRDDKYLFLLQKKLRIYNIEDKKHPRLVTSYTVANSTSPTIFSLSKNRDYLYITLPLSKEKKESNNINSALYIYDIKDINHINLVGKKNIDGIYGIWISPNEKKLFYTIERNDDKIIPGKKIGLADISDINHIKVEDESWRYFVGRGSHASVRSAFFSQNDKYLYIASGTYGVMVYDVSHNTLDLVQRTAGRKVLKFLNCTGAIYDIEHDEAYERLFAVGYEENEKKFKKLSCIKGFKKAYYIEGEKSVILEKRKILLVQNYDYFRDHHVDIYRW